MKQKESFEDQIKKMMVGEIIQFPAVGFWKKRALAHRIAGQIGITIETCVFAGLFQIHRTR